MNCATKQPANGVGYDRIYRNQRARQQAIKALRERDRNPSTIHRLRRLAPHWRVKAIHGAGIAVMVIGAMLPASMRERARVRGQLLLNARV